MIETIKTTCAIATFCAAVLVASFGAEAQSTQDQPGMMKPGMAGQHMGAGAQGGSMSCPMMGGVQGMMGQGMMGQGMMGQGMMGQGMMGQGMMGQGMMGRGMMMHGPAVEGRLAYLKAELAITDAQSSAWNGYAAAVKARMATMQGMHEGMMQSMHSGTAAARLDAHIKAMEAMTETLKALKPATEALYAVLSPDQRTKADQLLGMGCCMM